MGAKRLVAGVLSAMTGLLLLAIGPATASAAECTNNWVGPAEGAWQTAGNWSTGLAPTEADVACIGAGKTVTVNSGTNKAATVQGEGSLTVGATLELLNGATESSIAGLKMTGGTVTGPATLEITGTLSVEKQSTMSGTGTTVLPAGTTASLAAKLRLTKRDLVNKGTFAIGSSGSVEGSESPDVLNTGTLTFAGGTISAATVVNEGTIKKTGGTSSGIGSSFNNLGTVEVTGGTFSPGNGTSGSTSQWVASGGGKFTFGGTYYLSGTLTGPVEVSGSSANLTLEQLNGIGGSIEASWYAQLTVSGLFSSTIGTLSFGREGWNASHATLTGPGHLEIYDQLNAVYESTMTGAGTTTVKAGATAQVTAKTELKQQRKLVNAGTLTISGSGTLTTTETAEIVNTGTVTRSGTGTSGIGRFKNSGTVQIAEGALAFSSGSSEPTSEWHAAGSSQLRFGNGYSMSGTLSGLAIVEGSSSSLTLDGVNGPSAKLEVSWYGTVTVSGSPSTLGTLRFGHEGYNSAHGTVTGSGELRISGALEGAFEGTMSGSGSTVVLPAATATISARIKMAKRKLVNEGTLTFQEPGWVEGTEPFEIVNTGTTVFKKTNGISGVTFVNEGVVKKAGTTQSGISPQFSNFGTVEATEGLLGLSNGTSKPTSEMHASGSGGFVFTSGSGGSNFFLTGTLSGPMEIERPSTNVTMEALDATAGDVEISDYGQLTVSGSSPSTARSLTFGREGYNEGRGSLTGGGELRITDAMQAEYLSRISGTGSLVLLATANGSISTLSQMKDRRFVNHGNFTLASGAWIDLEAGVEFVNYGTFNVNLGGTTPSTAIGGKGSLASIFKNKGTVQRSGGQPLSSIEPPFENGGIVKGPVKIPRPIMVSSKEQFGKRCHMGDPVECATGNLSESQTDLAVGGRGVGLFLTRTYSALAAVAATGPGAFGYGWSGSFGDSLSIVESGAKVTVVLGNGSTIPFTRVSGSTYSGPAWSQAALSGSPEAGYTLTGANQVRMDFSGGGRLQDVIDRNGNETTLGYDESGRLTTIIDPAGRAITLTYNVGGQVATAEDPLGHLVKYTYEAGKLASVTRPGSEALRWQFKYDASRRITSMTDGRGGKATNEYDSSNRVISQTDPAGRTLTFKYEPFHTTITNKATGAVTDQWFTSTNQPFSITHGFGSAAASTETFAYDEAGQMVRATDGNGHATTYEYSPAGDMTSERDAEGNERKWAYNGTHDVISITEPGGETTTIARDANGNPESISRPGPGETTQTYELTFNGSGELEALTDPLERTWDYDYNKQGDLTGEADPEGNTLSIEYDEDSRAVAVVAPRGNAEGAEPAEFETTIERDARGWPLKVTNPLGETTEYSYDANGNMAAATDARGNTTKFTYNGADELTEIERANGALLKTGYDGAGLVTSRTDGNGRTTTYVRDALGNPVEVIDPLGRKTIQGFDGAGNLETVVDAAERTTTLTYDDADLLIGVDYSEAATPDASYEYDADGNLTRMVDGTGESTFAYDVLGRLSEMENGNGDVVSYDYDLADQLTQIAYPNGKSIARAFDGAGRLEAVTDWLGGTTSFAYDPDSNLKTITFPGGTENVDEYVHDRAGLAGDISFEAGSETLASLSYSRDPVGQVEDEAQTGLPGSAELGYGYDKNGRLTAAGEAGFEYDLADNLTNGLGSTNSYDAASQLETGTGISYSFDQLGERTESAPEAGPATTYGYDQAGGLISIERAAEGEAPAINQSLAYDGTGLLVSKASGLTTSHLTWDVGTALPLLLDDGENSYIYGPEGLAVEQISAEETPSYLHRDQLGSTRAITDAAGEVSATFSYGPFGSLTGATGSATTPLGFAGEYTDPETGLQYLRARFYDPATGQFLTRDPAEELTRQPYAYASDDPVNSVDPSGEIAAAAACAATIEIPIVGEVTCGAAAVTGIAAAGALAGSLLSPDETDEGEYVNPTYAGPTYVNPLTQGITQARGKGSDDPSCSPNGKRLRREGEEVLGRGHTDAARERWQEWIKGKSKRERKEYDDAGGPRPGKKNRR